jgi:hypothetical protein
MDDTDADYLIEAVGFVARRGRELLPLDRFDLRSGTWAYERGATADAGLSLEDAFRAGEEPRCRPLSASVRKSLYRAYLDEAEARAAELGRSAPRAGGTLPAGMAEFQFFELPPET